MKMKNKYIGLLMLSAAMVGCTDTWDDHYGLSSNTGAPTAGETLWEIISRDASLSNFAKLAKKTPYYRDEQHVDSTYSYADMLNGTQIFTLWAPENDAFTEAEWQQWMNRAETDGYLVQNQMITNNISLWRQLANGGGQENLAMLNGKRMMFDRVGATIAGIHMVDGKTNIPASNGTLHHVKSSLPFHYNLYEYIKDTHNENLDSLRAVVLAQDTVYFNEDISIQGKPDADGEPTYVDSVYEVSNNMFFASKRFPISGSVAEKYEMYDESFGQNIAGEDSSYVMILPNNAAWQQAYDKIKGYYKYANRYIDRDKEQDGLFNSTIRTEYSSFKFRDKLDAAALAQKSIHMDMVSPIVFNVNLQPNKAGRLGTWKVDDLLANANDAKYLINTYGDTLRTDASGWQQQMLFQGERIQMSNGVAIVNDTWNIPAKLYNPDIYIEVGHRSLFNYNRISSGGRSESVDFSNEQAKAWVDTVGVISKNTFFRFKGATDDDNAKIAVKLQGTDGENRESEVLSGKYDIYAVMVPDFYVTSKETIVGDTLKNKLTASVYYDDGKTTFFQPAEKTKTMVKGIEYDGKKVREVKLFEDFEFPYSYKNLIHSYPLLVIESSPGSSDVKKGYGRSFCIDRIILRRKD